MAEVWGLLSPIRSVGLVLRSLIACAAAQGPTPSEDALLQLQAFIASKGALPVSLTLCQYQSEACSQRRADPLRLPWGLPAGAAPKHLQRCINRGRGTLGR